MVGTKRTRILFASWTIIVLIFIWTAIAAYDWWTKLAERAWTQFVEALATDDVSRIQEVLDDGWRLIEITGGEPVWTVTLLDPNGQTITQPVFSKAPAAEAPVLHLSWYLTTPRYKSGSDRLRSVAKSDCWEIRRGKISCCAIDPWTPRATE